MIENLFQNVSPTLLALVLAILSVGGLLIVAGLGIANPVLWRMGMRNILRRPSQTLLLLGGLVLSTAVITASFGLPDSVAYSQRVERLRAIGNVDESVTGTLTQTQVTVALERLRQSKDVRAVTAISMLEDALTITSSRTGLSIHNVNLYAVPPDFDQVYGPMTDTSGRQVQVTDLRSDAVFVSAAMAQNFDVRPGETLQIDIGDQVLPFTAQAILSNDIGITSGEAVEAGEFPEVIMPLARAQQISEQTFHEQLIPDMICVSNVASSNANQSVMGLLRQLFPDAPADLHVPHALGQTDFETLRIHPLKPDVVEAIALQLSKVVFFTAAGQQFSWLLPIFSGMLVLAGLLLLALLVILLVAGRRAEMGISRAIGLQRSHLIQLLLFEGAGYAVLAAVLGILLGSGLTMLELAVISQLPKLAPGEVGSNPISLPVIGALHMWLSWQSVVAALCLGILTTLVGILLTALWVSRMNIIAAIRDLDEQPGRASHLRFWYALPQIVRRLVLSLAGVLLLLAGVAGGNAFLNLFLPNAAVGGPINPPSTPTILLSMALPVIGAVILVMTNADLLVTLIAGLLRRIRGLTPISRTSLAYPLTFRFRTGVTIGLLSLVTFLVLLLIVVNLGSVQEAEALTSSGGFQLEATVFGSQLRRYSDLPVRMEKLQQGSMLKQDFAAVGLLRLMYDLAQSNQEPPMHLEPGRPVSYPLDGPPMVADDAFLSHVLLPLYLHAQGFDSDRQVWDALRDHPGYAVIRYDARIDGLPASTGFSPFVAEIPDSLAPDAHYHRVTIVGFMAANAPWQVLVSVPTARSIVNPPYIPFINSYQFRLQPGVDEVRAAQDLNSLLDGSRRGINVRSLDRASINGITQVFTLFLSGYLALGLLFGALAIGVISSRAVVERRQQIGMLRALGFSRSLIWGSFLLEFSFVIALSLIIGCALALWLAYQIARVTYQDFPLPLGTIALILLGSFLAALISTLLPARQAARLHPAEALRYE